MDFSYCYWCLAVRNANLILLLTSAGQEWQFHIATDVYWSRMAISHWNWHLVVNNGNFTLLLTSTGQECQFHIATDINWSRMANFTLLLTPSWSRMAISHCYWHLVVKNDNFTLLLTSTGQESQFHIATEINCVKECQFHIVTDISLFKNANFTLVLISTGQESQFHIATDI